MSKTLINTTELEKEINVFETSLNKIKEIFQNERKNLNHMNEENVWAGKTQEAIYNNQVAFQNNFEPIEEALQVYINFMKKSLNDYKRFEQTQVLNQENNASDLDVNS